MDIKKSVQIAIQHALQDVQVELIDEFDRNFERKAFFTQAWQRRKTGYRADRPLLVDSGRLRGSISSQINEGKVTFTSSAPYAAIHNNGGIITVTARMKGYFWYRYRQEMGRREAAKGETEAARFFRAMATKKIGAQITIPGRKFIGASPEVKRIAQNALEDALNELFTKHNFEIKTR